MFEKQEGESTRDGWWRHPETGAVVELINDPDLGTPLTNAYKKAGWEYVGTEDPRLEKAAPVKEDTKVSPKK